MPGKINYSLHVPDSRAANVSYRIEIEADDLSDRQDGVTLETLKMTVLNLSYRRQLEVCASLHPVARIYKVTVDPEATEDQEAVVLTRQETQLRSIGEDDFAVPLSMAAKRDRLIRELLNLRLRHPPQEHWWSPGRNVRHPLVIAKEKEFVDNIFFSIMTFSSRVVSVPPMEAEEDFVVLDATGAATEIPTHHLAAEVPAYSEEAPPQPIMPPPPAYVSDLPEYFPVPPPAPEQDDRAPTDEILALMNEPEEIFTPTNRT